MAILAECPVCHRKWKTTKRKCWNPKTEKGCGQDLNAAKAGGRCRYYVTYRINGKQRSEFAGCTISEAQASDGKRKSQKREGRVLDLLPESKMTFHELIYDWYLTLPKIQGRKSFKDGTTQSYFRKFSNDFGDKRVDKIKVLDLENLQFDRQKQGYAPATVDYELSIVKTMIKRAYDNDLVGPAIVKTFDRIRSTLKPRQNARSRIWTKDEFYAVYGVSPPYLKVALAIGFFTGMRKGEILGLTWDRVDLKNAWIYLRPQDTKTKYGREIPISHDLLTILKDCPRGLHDKHIILREGEPVRQNKLKQDLETSCQHVNIPYGRKAQNGLTFHDLRHSFVTHSRKAGVQESVIMAITGHKTRKMLDRYNTVDCDDTREAVTTLQAHFQSVDQCVDHEKVI